MQICGTFIYPACIQQQRFTDWWFDWNDLFQSGSERAVVYTISICLVMYQKILYRVLHCCKMLYRKWVDRLQYLDGLHSRVRRYPWLCTCKTREPLFKKKEKMGPILIILLYPTIKTYCSAHGEQYLGITQTSTSNYSFCSRWQEPEQSLLVSTSGRRPSYKYAYTVISLPPVWLTMVELLLLSHWACSKPSDLPGSGRTMRSVSSSSCPVRWGCGGNFKWC